MTVGELIEKLKELPEDCNIYFRDYDKTYDNVEVMWDITLDKQTVIFCGEEIKEPKTGHWIPVYPPTDSRDDQKCSECGQIYPGATRYCPDCGIKMFEPRESEEV